MLEAKETLKVEDNASVTCALCGKELHTGDNYVEGFNSITNFTHTLCTRCSAIDDGVDYIDFNCQSPVDVLRGVGYFECDDCGETVDFNTSLSEEDDTVTLECRTCGNEFESEITEETVRQYFAEMHPALTDEEFSELLREMEEEESEAERDRLEECLPDYDDPVRHSFDYMPEPINFAENALFKEHLDDLQPIDLDNLDQYEDYSILSD